jgi:hypothetical protein
MSAPHLFSWQDVPLPTLTTIVGCCHGTGVVCAAHALLRPAARIESARAGTLIKKTESKYRIAQISYLKFIIDGRST